MKKILFRINNNYLIISEKIRLNTEYKNIINTNVISCNELIFSDEYIQNNQRIISTFFNQITNDYNIDTISIQKNEYASIVLEVFKNNKNIINLILKEDEQLTFKLCETIIKTNIKNINCYNLQPFMIEYLDKYNIIVESRNEILFISKFMKNNNLCTFSSLFYKVNLQIDLPMNNQDELDFEAFCKINKYLKTIHVTYVNKNDLENIINVLISNNKKNIKIIIHNNELKPEVIEYLKEFNKKKSKKYKIYYKLEYSKEYLQENIVKQTNNSILKTCGFIIIAIITFTFGYVFYDNYSSMQSVESIQSNIQNTINITSNTPEVEQIIAELNEGKEEEEEKVVINRDLVALYNINPEVVGWLTVPNTNIDYAVVKTNNNDYYLNHNFNMQNDKNGWVFMDYRNNVEELSDNVIVYAHNRYYSGVMFGTLQNTMRYSWYSNPDNLTITLKTFYKDLHYHVFSIYKIAVTNDYMRTIFVDDADRLEFYNMLKNRSLYDFDIPLQGSDKILTLSTCADENNRYVVHAVLVD